MPCRWMGGSVFWRLLVRRYSVAGAGQTVRFQVPGGTRTVRVEQILYQPEAAGHYHV